MAQPTSAPGTRRSTPTQGFAVPSGAEIYDAIMRKIEPELIRANLGKLDTPYKNETEAKHSARYRRYSKAFAAYKKAFSVWSLNLKKAVQAYKRAVFKASEKISKREEEAKMQALEEQMNNA